MGKPRQVCFHCTRAMLISKPIPNYYAGRYVVTTLTRHLIHLIHRHLIHLIHNEVNVAEHSYTTDFDFFSIYFEWSDIENQKLGYFIPAGFKMKTCRNHSRLTFLTTLQLAHLQEKDSLSELPAPLPLKTKTSNCLGERERKFIFALLRGLDRYWAN